MILAIDFRTDIPAFYGDWLLNRFEEGYLYFRNPSFPNTIHKVILDNDHIEGIIWCSKNYLPILHRLNEITNKFPSIFHYTITGYEYDLEPNVPQLDLAVNTFKKLSDAYGKDYVVWRYDPILMTTKYNKDWHSRKFEDLCQKLSPYTNRVVINFISIYEKVKRHMPDLTEISSEEKEYIVKEFVGITQKYGLDLQTCGNGLQFKNIPGVTVTGCLDTTALEMLKIYPKNEAKASTWGCKCYPHTAIGEYCTCLHKCKYCYASADFNKCDENYSKHDPRSPLLIGWPNGNEKIIEMNPKKIGMGTKQLKLDL